MRLASGGPAVATFSDTDTSDMAGDFTATINWSDGVTTAATVVGSNGSFTVDGGHTYADEGSDTASVTLSHNPDGANATASGLVAVAEADVLTAHDGSIKASIREPFSGAVAAFTDTDTANVAGDFAATIAWGDGTTTTGTVAGSNGLFIVSGTHAYAHPGKEDVTVTLTDDGAGTASAVSDTKATVSNGVGDGATSGADFTALLNQFMAAGFESGGGSPAITTDTSSPITQAFTPDSSPLTSPTPQAFTPESSPVTNPTPH